MDVDEAQIDEGLYSRQLQVLSFVPRDCAYRVFSLLDMYWAMKVCILTLVEELHQQEFSDSYETYGGFQCSDRRAGRSGR